MQFIHFRKLQWLFRLADQSRRPEIWCSRIDRKVFSCPEEGPLFSSLSLGI